VENDDEASILLSICSTAPHLDVSLRCKIDAKLKEECALIAWKVNDLDREDQENEDDDECSQDGLTDSHVSSDSYCADSDSQHEGEGEADLDNTNHSESSCDDICSATSGSDNEKLWDNCHRIADKLLQYCVVVERENLIESSLNALQAMSKCVAKV
jgi:hypothetical protein